MLYTKRKNNKLKYWIMKFIQLALVLGILFFGYEAINRFSNPSQDSEIVHVVVVQAPIQLIEVQPRNIEPAPALDSMDYFQLALQHHLANEYNEAILDYSRAIALDENMSASWLNRAVAYEQMGNNYNAMFDYMRFIQRDGISISSYPLVVDSTTMQLTVYRNTVQAIPLQLNSGEVVNIGVTSVENNLVDPLIVLTDSEGRPMIANDDARRQDGSLISMNSHINNYTVTRTGRYFLLVTHAGGGENGIHSGSVAVDIQINE